MAAKAWPSELYDTTPIKINFDVNGKTYTYETKMGSAFAAADTVIIGEDLYIKLSHSKPAQYIAMGKVKKNEDGTYTWINTEDSFSFVCDVETKAECISFDSSEKDLAPYKKSWEEVWELESHNPELKAQVNDIIKKKDAVLTGIPLPSDGGCGAPATEEVQTEELKKEAKPSLTDEERKEKFINTLKLLERLNQQPYPKIGEFLQNDPSRIMRIENHGYVGGYELYSRSDNPYPPYPGWGWGTDFYYEK